MEKLRAFVAVEIDQGIKKRLADLQEILKEAEGGVRWVEVENIHITLKFLGHIDEANLSAVKDIVKIAITGVSPFCIEFKGVGAFPRPERPRVLTVTVKDTSGSLSRINAGLEEEFFGKLGIEKEDRRYSPHLTLGRIKFAKNVTPLVRLMARHSADDFGVEQVESVVLMQSQLSPEGPIYTQLEKFYLG